MKLFATSLLTLLVCLVCMAPTTVTKPTHITIIASSGACPAPIAGTLTLRATASRSNGVSPLLVFFDATTTTDTGVSANMTSFQDVTYTWDFGDGGASGTSTWLYGARPGVATRNVDIGPIAAHLYRTAGADTVYVATVTATDLAGNSASCTIPAVTAFDPSGTNGWPGTATTCVANVTIGSGCPAGASTLITANFNTAIGTLGNNKRILFKCGDTFTGDYAQMTAIKSMVGAYGGCENTLSNRPVIRDTGTTGELAITVQSGDIRIADLDLQGNASTVAMSIQSGTNIVPYQILWYNLNSNNNGASYYTPQVHEFGLINSNQLNMTNIGTFLNLGGANPCPPANGQTTCWTGPFPDDNYMAMMGNSINGAGVPNGSGIELVRIAYCRLCVISHNSLQHANNIGALLKFHESNQGSQTPWAGVYTELTEISDNLFFGLSGGQQVELAPQNSSFDERIRNVVFERNLLQPNDSTSVNVIVSAQNTTLRDNVFYSPAGQTNPSYYMVQLGARGNFPAWQSQFNEVYNNTGVMLTNHSGQSMIAFSAAPPLTLVGINSVARNNLYFDAGGNPTITNNGTGNTVSNNTVTSTANPVFTNPSGTFGVISDFKPTNSFTGGVSVPVIIDALGVTWPPTWDLGGVHH